MDRKDWKSRYLRKKEEHDQILRVGGVRSVRGKTSFRATLFKSRRNKAKGATGDTNHLQFGFAYLDQNADPELLVDEITPAVDDNGLKQTEVPCTPCDSDSDATNYDSDVTEYSEDEVDVGCPATHVEPENSEPASHNATVNLNEIIPMSDVLDFENFETSGCFIRNNQLVERLLQIKTANAVSSSVMVEFSKVLMDVMTGKLVVNTTDIPMTSKSFETKGGLRSVGRRISWKCNVKDCGGLWTTVELRKDVKRFCPEGHEWDRSMEHIIHLSLRDIMKQLLPVVWPHVDEKESQALANLKHRIADTSGNVCSSSDIFVTVSTDGYVMTSTANTSGWPVLAWINGTSIRQRKTCNMMLLGLWKGERGSNKPSSYHHLLDPVIDQILATERNPILWTTFCGQPKSSRVFIYTVLADSQARNGLMGIPAFQHRFGCPYCFLNAPGAKFPFHAFEDVRLRTHESYSKGYEYSVEKVTVKKKKRSIVQYKCKPNSPFLKIPYFDMIEGFPVDSMHCVWLGCFKKFINAFLDTKYHECEFYIGPQDQKHLNEALLRIRPPNRTSAPKDILTQRATLRAHDWQDLVLYYLPFLLREYLKWSHFKHFLLLVEAVTSLMKLEPTKDDIDTAEHCIHLFCADIPKLYPDHPEFETFNCHLLLHLPMFVRLHGSLSLFTMAPFENRNFKLKKSVTGTQFKVHQAVRAFIEDLQVIAKGEQNAVQNSEASSTLEVELPCRHRGLVDEVRKVTSENCSYFGKFTGTSGRSIVGSSGTKAKRHDDSHILFNKTHVMQVECFINDPDLETVFMYGKVWKVRKAFPFIEHLLETDGQTPTYQRIAVPERFNVLTLVQDEGDPKFSMFVNDLEGIAE